MNYLQTQPLRGKYAFYFKIKVLHEDTNYQLQMHMSYTHENEMKVLYTPFIAPKLLNVKTTVKLT